MDPMTASHIAMELMPMEVHAMGAGVNGDVIQPPVASLDFAEWFMAHLILHFHFSTSLLNFMKNEKKTKDRSPRTLNFEH